MEGGIQTQSNNDVAAIAASAMGRRDDNFDEFALAALISEHGNRSTDAVRDAVQHLTTDRHNSDLVVLSKIGDMNVKSVETAREVGDKLDARLDRLNDKFDAKLDAVLANQNEAEKRELTRENTILRERVGREEIVKSILARLPVK